MRLVVLVHLRIGLAVVSFGVESKSASGAVGIGACEFVDGDAFELISEALSESEVQVAYSVRVDVGCVSKGTGLEDEFDVGTSLAEVWIESTAGDGLLELGDWTGRWIVSNLDAVASLASDVHGGSTCGDHIDEQDAEPSIWSGVAPSLFRCRIHSEQETWPPRTIRWLRPAAEEFGVNEFCEVLADRVVVESEEIGEFGDVHGSVNVDGMAIDSVARWVSEGTRLGLEDGLPI